MPLTGSRDAPPPTSNVNVEVGRMQERMTSLSRDVTDGHARIDKSIDGLGAKLASSPTPSLAGRSSTA